MHSQIKNPGDNPIQVTAGQARPGWLYTHKADHHTRVYLCLRRTQENISYGNTQFAVLHISATRLSSGNHITVPDTRGGYQTLPKNVVLEIFNED